MTESTDSTATTNQDSDSEPVQPLDTISVPVRVNVDNFARAETHNYFARFANEEGFAKLKHARILTPIEKQAVIRLNRDTLYSFGVFDLEASDLIVTMPDAGKRFMSVQVINEDHFTLDVFYAPDSHTLTLSEVGTRYVCLAIRTFVDPNSPEDIQEAHELQDRIKIQQESAGKLELPDWEQSSLTTMRKAVLNLVAANGKIDSSRMFGRKEQIDPVQHLMGTAAAWGGNPANTALYAGGAPERNDGKTAHIMTLKDVPVDGFWSISVYNQDGYFEKNERNIYTVNNVTAKTNEDGSVTVYFGGDENALNFIPVIEGWNYVLRLYRPRREILDGTWEVPVTKLAE